MVDRDVTRRLMISGALLIALVAVAWSGNLTGDGVQTAPSWIGLRGVLALALLGLGFLYFQSNRLRPSQSSAYLLTGILIATGFVVTAPEVLGLFELSLPASELGLIGSLAALYYLTVGSLSRGGESGWRRVSRGGWSQVAVPVVVTLWIILATIPLDPEWAVVLDTFTALLWSGAGAYIVTVGFRRDDEVVSTLGIACLALGSVGLLTLAGVHILAIEITSLAAVALAVASAYLDLANVVDRQRGELDETREAMRDLAHQARTAITAIEGTLFGLDTRMDLAPEDREALKEALRMELQSLRLMLTRDEPPRVQPIRVGSVLRPALSAADVSEDALRWIGPREMEATFATGALTEIVQALIDNAHTHSGTPDVEVEVEQLDGLVEIRVIDRGEGVADAVRHALFERGVKRHGSPGKGLGLNISRRLARSHGGDLDYRENPGGGSQFVLSLPSSGRVLDLSLYEKDEIVEIVENHRLPMQPPSPERDGREARRAGQSNRHRDPHPGGEVAGV